jgi:hypothetical protein
MYKDCDSIAQKVQVNTGTGGDGKKNGTISVWSLSMGLVIGIIGVVMFGF